MPKRIKKEKPIKEAIFGTRNETIVLYSRIFGHTQTNEILERCLSNNKVISKIKDAKINNFNVNILPENDEIVLEKMIMGVNTEEYWRRYGETVRTKLSNLYDDEATNAIWTYYNTVVRLPLTSEEVTDLNMKFYSPLIGEKNKTIIVDMIYAIDETAGRGGFAIIFPVKTLLGIFSNIKKESENKIIQYKTDGEEILSIFIESLIEIFRDKQGLDSPQPPQL